MQNWAAAANQDYDQLKLAVDLNHIRDDLWNDIATSPDIEMAQKQLLLYGLESDRNGGNHYHDTENTIERELDQDLQMVPG